MDDASLAPGTLPQLIRVLSISIFSVLISAVVSSLSNPDSIWFFYLLAWLLAIIGIIFHLFATVINSLWGAAWRDSLRHDEGAESLLEAIEKEWPDLRAAFLKQSREQIPAKTPIYRSSIRAIKFGIYSFLGYCLALMVLAVLVHFGLLTNIAATVDSGFFGLALDDIVSQFSALQVIFAVLPLGQIEPANRIAIILLLIFPALMILMSARCAIRVLDEFHLRVYHQLVDWLGRPLGSYIWFVVLTAVYLFATFELIG